MSASAPVTALALIAIIVIRGVRVRNMDADVSARSKTLWSLVAWGFLMAVGLVIWMIVHSQISH